MFCDGEMFQVNFSFFFNLKKKKKKNCCSKVKWSRKVSCGDFTIVLPLEINIKEKIILKGKNIYHK